MRLLALLALPALFAVPAAADEKPLTKAEYDELAKPIKEKLQKAKDEWADAGKRVVNAKSVKGAGKYLEDYLNSKNQSESTARKLAAAKDADKPNEKEIKKLEILLAQTTKDAENSLKLLKSVNPDVAKNGVQAAEDQKAAKATIDMLEAELKKLGPPPKK